MNKKYFILFLILSLYSCKDKTTGLPRNSVIPREKFVQILVDFHKMDAITSTPEYYNMDFNADSINVLAPVLEKYGYTKVLYDSTISAYSRLPGEYMKVYDEVILKLNLELDLLRKAEPTVEAKP